MIEEYSVVETSGFKNDCCQSELANPLIKTKGVRIADKTKTAKIRNLIDVTSFIEKYLPKKS